MFSPTRPAIHSNQWRDISTVSAWPAWIWMLRGLLPVTSQSLFAHQAA